ncbi:hypothetical protein NliqN6_5791 [Naganishia liquefaciens]|uniref:Cysteine protease n=1 Tax=Naganishia liquefaciens TaxID=104408 RepID=A0A8H3U081_9TREE|nr:hypothetical protein NliqN6_5791 [Naganishia liquefaciens]
MARDTSPHDTETSFLDVPAPVQQRRSWRRPQSASAPRGAGVMVESPSARGNRLRKKASWLGGGARTEAGMGFGMGMGRRASMGEAEDDVSVDSRTSRGSGGVVVVNASSSGASPVGGSVPLGTRMSNWWTSLVAVEPNGEPRRARRQGEPPSRGLLAQARQKAVGGVRYLLDAEAQPETSEDVWVRGVVHRFEYETLAWPQTFLDDLASTIWCTYRSQYAPITAIPEIIATPESYRSQRLPRIPAEETRTSPWQWMTTDRAGLTTDAGWGCMLRTGQSVLANALVHHHLGRDWRLGPDSRSDSERYATYVQILGWFLDDPSAACPFSVHRMALVGKQLGKSVGEWFGPSTAAGALKTLTNGFPPCGLAVVTATDSTIYASEVLAASQQDVGPWADLMETLPMRAPSRAQGAWGRAGVLILAGVRLGMQGVNPLYHESIKALFTFPQSVGIAGGRPSSSYYFIGTQGDSLFYLDPHLTRPAIPLKTRDGERDAEDPATTTNPNESGKDHVEWLVNAYSPDQLRTFHCDKVKKMPLSSLDPSMLMGFLCRDYNDWVDLRERLNALPQRIISIEETVPTWGDDSDDPDIESFTETDVDEGSDGLSRQSSVSEGVFQAEGLSLASDAEEEVVDLPRQVLPLGSAADTPSSPPLTPTVSVPPERVRFPRTEGDARDGAEAREHGFESIDVPSLGMTSPRHRSKPSGNQTILAGRTALSERDEASSGENVI